MIATILFKSCGIRFAPLAASKIVREAKLLHAIKAALFQPCRGC
jgi:hypothetical protein